MGAGWLWRGSLVWAARCCACSDYLCDSLVFYNRAPFFIVKEEIFTLKITLVTAYGRLKGFVSEARLGPIIAAILQESALE